MLRTVSAAALLAANVGFLSWYVFFGYRSYFHSDSATKVLLAKEIADTADFFPDDWFFANNDLFVFFGHIPIIPFAVGANPSFYAHAISGLIFALLFLWAVYLVSGLFHITLPSRLLITASIAGGISGLMAENLFGQVSYGPLTCLVLFSLYLSGRALDPQEPRQYSMLSSLSIVCLLAFWGNPLRAGVYVLAPTVGAIIAMPLLERTKDVMRRCMQLALFILLGAVAGILLHTSTLTGVFNVKGVSSANWLGYEKITENTTHLVGGILALIGALPTAGVPVASVEGALVAFRFAVGILAFCLVPLAVARLIKAELGTKRLVGVFTLISLATPAIIFVGTSLPDVSDPIQSARYLAPGVVVAVVALLCTSASEKQKQWFTLATSLFMAALLASGFTSYVQSDPNSRILLGAENRSISPATPFNANELEQAGQFLRAQGLSYGYATYWHAGALSVLNEGLPTVRAITIHNGLPEPFRHLSSNRWYKSESHRGRSFLLLTNYEVALVDWSLMAELGISPEAWLHDGKFQIIVFSQNLAELLPAWDVQHTQPTVIPLTSKSLTGIGSFVPGKNGKRPALIAKPGSSGVLHYGPYVGIAPGTYKVVFDVKADHAHEGAVKLDVASSPDQMVLAEKTLEESDSPQEMIVTTSEMKVVEFRVWSLGRSSVEFHGVTLKRISDAKEEGPLLPAAKL